MNSLNKIFLIATLTLAGLAALAHNVNDSGCLKQDSVFLGADTDYTAACEIKTEPTIKTTRRTYPLLKDNPYSVRYWDALMHKTVTKVNHYTTYVYNVCTQKAQYSGLFDTIEKSTISFFMENPNLSDSVATSYELAPMTDDEAKIAFQKLKQSCQDYKPGNNLKY